MISEVHNIDNMEFMASLPDKFFDLAIVDIEYNIGASKPTKKPNSALQKNGSRLSVKSPVYTPKDWDFKKSTAAYFNELQRVSINQIIWGGNYYGLSGGYLVWNKLNKDTDQYGCELAWLSFTKRTDVVNFLWSGMIQGVYCGTDAVKASIQQGDKRLNEKRIHPTQKPVPLYKWQLQSYAKKGDKIFDSHMGSQSSRLAAYEMGFDYWGCELDKEYFEAGNKRFEEFKLQQRLFTPEQVQPVSLGADLFANEGNKPNRTLK